MNALKLAVGVAATWRITRLIVDDEVAAPLRNAVGDRWPGSKAEYLVNCPYCVSVWAGAAVVVAPAAVTSALALSAGTLAVRWVGEVTETALSNRRF